MSIMLVVSVGGIHFPIETKSDLDDAIKAIRDPAHAGETVGVLINKYFFPAGGVRELKASVKSRTAQELEGRNHTEDPPWYGEGSEESDDLYRGYFRGRTHARSVEVLFQISDDSHFLSNVVAVLKTLDKAIGYYRPYTVLLA